MTEKSKLLTANGAAFDPAAYEVVLRPLSQAEGGGWLATIPLLAGCTGDGDTELAAIEDVRAAGLEWAEAASADGDPIPDPTSHRPMAAE